MSNLDVKFVNESVPVKVIIYRALCSSSKHVSLLSELDRSFFFFFFWKEGRKKIYLEIEYDNDTTLIIVYTRIYIFREIRKKRKKNCISSYILVKQANSPFSLKISSFLLIFAKPRLSWKYTHFLLKYITLPINYF